MAQNSEVKGVLKGALAKKAAVEKRGFRLYPFQWIYKIRIGKFHPFPLGVMLVILLITIPPILSSLGFPLPQLTDIPVVSDIIRATLGATTDRDLFVNMTWVLWWPLFIFTIIIFRRIWCGGFCPFGLLTDIGNWVGKKLRLGKEPRVISITKYVFMGFLTFLMIGYLHDAVNITNSVIMSVEFVMFFILFAFIVGVILPRRSFCRSFCFVGALPHLFGRLAFLGLKTDRSKCEKCEGKWCQTGTEHLPMGISELKAPLLNVDGCPMFLNVPQLGHQESNRHCILCGNCVKNCPYDAIEYKFLQPNYEITRGIQLNGHETFFTLGILAVLGMFIAMEGGLLGVWGSLITPILKLPTTNYHWLFAGSFTVVAAVVIAILYALATRITSALTGIPWGEALRKFGYIYLPFAYLAFFRDIFVVYFVGGSVLSGYIARGPDWAKLIVPFADNALIIIGALWSLQLAYRVVQVVNGERKGNVLGAALPHMLLVLGLLLYWLKYSLPDYLPFYTALSVPVWIPLLLPALIFGGVLLSWRLFVPEGVGA